MSDTKKNGLTKRLMNHVFGGPKRFVREENGAMIIFGLTIFMMMLVASGMAIDFMRHENMRTRLQATLDRAVLAAADLDQQNSPQEVVESYFEKAGLDNYELYVDVNEGLNYRTVRAQAQGNVRSMFLNMVGIDEIAAPAIGGAEERVNKVEVSLVLDISGSMDDNDKLENMQIAAKEFIEAMITEDTEELVSVSLIPYTGHVNAGEDLYSFLNVNERHSYNHCIEFEAEDFTTTTLDRNKTYEQVQHYEYSGYYYGYNVPIDDPWCSDKPDDTIIAYQNDVSTLSGRIDNFAPRTATGIHYAMKWGVALLDPDIRPVIDDLIAAGKVPSVFSGRPANWKADTPVTEQETIKTVVLMTDGMNVNQYRIENWAYNSSSEYRHWRKYTLWYYLNNYVNWWNHGNYYDQIMTSDDADDYLADICAAARAKEILVFSIAFDISDNPDALAVMQNCASSDSHFYKVEGVEISEAFGDIASTINQLRLIQ